MFQPGRVEKVGKGVALSPRQVQCTKGKRKNKKKKQPVFEDAFWAVSVEWGGNFRKTIFMKQPGCVKDQLDGSGIKNQGEFQGFQPLWRRICSMASSMDLERRSAGEIPTEPRILRRRLRV
jgi:hypothetical protein